MWALCVRITTPIGQINYIPHIRDSDIYRFTRDSEHSILAFGHTDNFTYMNYAISKHSNIINFAIVDNSTGAQYQCDKIPCIAGFHKNVHDRTIPDAPTSSIDFSIWVTDFLHTRINDLYTHEALNRIFHGTGYYFLGVDQDDPPTDFPTKERFYRTFAWLFDDFGVHVTPGYYIYRTVDRQLVRISSSTKNWKVYTNSPLVDLMYSNQNQLVVTYLVDSNDDYDKAVSILTSLAHKYSNYTYGVSYGPAESYIRQIGGFAGLSPPIFTVINMTSGDRWATITDVFDLDIIHSYMQRINAGIEPQVPISSPPIYELELNNTMFNASRIAAPGAFCVFIPDYSNPDARSHALNVETARRILGKHQIPIMDFDYTVNDWPEWLPLLDGIPALMVWPPDGKDGLPKVIYNEPDAAEYVELVSSLLPTPIDPSEYSHDQILAIYQILNDEAEQREQQSAHQSDEL